eukprot:g7957.t1
MEAALPRRRGTSPRSIFAVVAVGVFAFVLGSFGSTLFASAAVDDASPRNPADAADFFAQHEEEAEAEGAPGNRPTEVLRPDIEEKARIFSPGSRSSARKATPKSASATRRNKSATEDPSDFLLVALADPGEIRGVKRDTGEPVFRYELGHPLVGGSIVKNPEHQQVDEEGKNSYSKATPRIPRFTVDFDGSVLYTRDSVQFWSLPHVHLKNLVEKSPITSLPGFPGLYFVGRKSTQFHQVNLNFEVPSVKGAGAEDLRDNDGASEDLRDAASSTRPASPGKIFFDSKITTPAEEQRNGTVSDHRIGRGPPATNENVKQLLTTLSAYSNVATTTPSSVLPWTSDDRTASSQPVFNNGKLSFVAPKYQTVITGLHESSEKPMNKETSSPTGVLDMSRAGGAAGGVQRSSGSANSAPSATERVIVFGEAEYILEAMDSVEHKPVWNAFYTEIKPVELEQVQDVPGLLQKRILHTLLENRRLVFVENDSVWLARKASVSEEKDGSMFTHHARLHFEGRVHSVHALVPTISAALQAIGAPAGGEDVDDGGGPGSSASNSNSNSNFNAIAGPIEDPALEKLHRSQWKKFTVAVIRHGTLIPERRWSLGTRVDAEHSAHPGEQNHLHLGDVQGGLFGSRPSQNQLPAGTPGKSGEADEPEGAPAPGGSSTTSGELQHSDGPPSRELVLVRELHAQTRNSELLQKDILQRLGLPLVSSRGKTRSRSSSTLGSGGRGAGAGGNFYHQERLRLMLPGPIGGAVVDEGAAAAGGEFHPGEQLDRHMRTGTAFSATVWNKLVDSFRRSTTSGSLASSTSSSKGSSFDGVFADEFDVSHFSQDGVQLEDHDMGGILYREDGSGDGYLDDGGAGFGHSGEDGTYNSGGSGLLLPSSDDGSDTDSLSVLSVSPATSSSNPPSAAGSSYIRERIRQHRSRYLSVEEFLDEVRENPFILDKRNLPVQSKVGGAFYPGGTKAGPHFSANRQGFRKYVRESISEPHFLKVVLLSLLVGMLLLVAFLDFSLGFRLRRQLPGWVGLLFLNSYLLGLKKTLIPPKLLCVALYVSVLALVLGCFGAGLVVPPAAMLGSGGPPDGQQSSMLGSDVLDSSSTDTAARYYRLLRTFAASVSVAIPFLYLGLRVKTEDVEHAAERLERWSHLSDLAASEEVTSFSRSHKVEVAGSTRGDLSDTGDRRESDRLAETQTVHLLETSTNVGTASSEIAANAKNTRGPHSLEPSPDNPDNVTFFEGVSYLLGYQGLQPILVPPESNLGLSLMVGPAVPYLPSGPVISLQNSLMFRQYEDVTYLGEGGFGVVYKAKNKLDESYAAFKVKSYRLSAHENISKIERSFNEVKTFLAMKHKHLVDFHMHWCEESQFLPDKFDVKCGGREWPVDEEEKGREVHLGGARRDGGDLGEKDAVKNAALAGAVKSSEALLGGVDADAAGDVAGQTGVQTGVFSMERSEAWTRKNSPAAKPLESPYPNADNNLSPADVSKLPPLDLGKPPPLPTAMKEKVEKGELLVDEQDQKDEPLRHPSSPRQPPSKTQQENGEQTDGRVVSDKLRQSVEKGKFAPLVRPAFLPKGLGGSSERTKTSDSVLHDAVTAQEDETHPNLQIGGSSPSSSSSASASASITSSSATSKWIVNGAQQQSLSGGMSTNTADAFNDILAQKAGLLGGAVDSHAVEGTAAGGSQSNTIQFLAGSQTAEQKLRDAKARFSDIRKEEAAAANIRRSDETENGRKAGGASPDSGPPGQLVRRKPKASLEDGDASSTSSKHRSKKKNENAPSRQTEDELDPDQQASPPSADSNSDSTSLDAFVRAKSAMMDTQELLRHKMVTVEQIAPLFEVCLVMHMELVEGPNLKAFLADTRRSTEWGVFTSMFDFWEIKEGGQGGPEFFHHSSKYVDLQLGGVGAGSPGDLVAGEMELLYPSSPVIGVTNVPPPVEHDLHAGRKTSSAERLLSERKKPSSVTGAPRSGAPMSSRGTTRKHSQVQSESDRFHCYAKVEPSPGIDDSPWWDCAVEFEWMRQLTKGMRAIHKKGFVHRDLKPQNCFLDLKQGLLKIGDFGLSSNRALVGQDTQRQRGPLSLHWGTPMYMPPEGNTLNESTDVYAVGLIMLQLLCPRFRTAMERQLLIDAFKSEKVEVISELDPVEEYCKGHPVPSSRKPSTAFTREGSNAMLYQQHGAAGSNNTINAGSSPTLHQMMGQTPTFNGDGASSPVVPVEFNINGVPPGTFGAAPTGTPNLNQHQAADPRRRASNHEHIERLNLEQLNIKVNGKSASSIAGATPTPSRAGAAPSGFLVAPEVYREWYEVPRNLIRMCGSHDPEKRISSEDLHMEMKLLRNRRFHLEKSYGRELGGQGGVPRASTVLAMSM